MNSPKTVYADKPPEIVTAPEGFVICQVCGCLVAMGAEQQHNAALHVWLA